MKPPLEEVAISYSDESGWTVNWADKYLEKLSWDEMLGMVAILTVPAGSVEARSHYSPQTVTIDFES